ncbi:MAG: TVP38/TMEM64 family protein, partial [Actinomycetota bacterium]|nr:TVP38/TMEM64 family protein [Actinomycetota bacterium]
EGFGPLAPAVFVLLLVAQAVLAPLPAPALAAAGGYVFGAFWGFVLTWLGALLGGVLCFALSRALGRGFVARSARLEGLDRRVEEHGTVIVFVLRLIPVVSFDAISYAAGLTRIPFWRFLLATALGMAPGTFVFVYLGGASPGPGLYAALGGLAVLAVAAYAYYRRNLSSRCS